MRDVMTRDVKHSASRMKASTAAESGIDICIGNQAIHIDAPQAVRVEETAEGATQALQIDDAAGRRLTMRFRVASAPGALDGVAPGER